MNVNLVLWVIGAICLLFAAVGIPATRVNLGWLGLFLIAIADHLRL